jgi:hypothetical protein
VRFVAGRSRRIAGSHEGLLILAAVVALIGVVVLAILVGQWRTWVRFRDEGATTTAAIVDHRTRSGKSTSYYLTFRYSASIAGDPRSFTVEENVGRDLYVRLPIGAATQARYLVAQPAVASIAWTPSLPLGYPLGSFVAFAVIVLGATGVAWKWQDLRLLSRSGCLLQGRLLSCRGQRGSKGTYTVTVRYRFETPDGRTLDREASQVRNDMKQVMLPPPGTPVLVVYVSDKLHQVL